MSATIRERRFTLELWQMSTDFENKGDSQPLCQLAYFNASFYLNSIPQAVVAPLFGELINLQSHPYTGNVSHGVLLEDLLKIASKRVPVAVILKVNHSFSSDLNNDTIDKQYWKPEIRLDNVDDYGTYDTNEIIIFKGYILPPSLEIIKNQSQIRLTLTHWLSNIADLSLLTTYCNTNTPKDLALQMYDTPTEDGKTSNTWVVLKKRTNGAFTKPKSLWNNGIKNIFTSVLNYYKDKIYNNYIEKRRKDIQTTIDNIEADETLTLTSKFSDNTNTLDNLIGGALASENYQNFINTTAWDKLIKQYSPAFLFSVVPRVSKALLIPTPATEYTDEDKITTIKTNEIFSVNSYPLSGVLLNRVVCAPSVPTDTSTSYAGPATYIKLSTYPEVVSENRSGFIQTITYPNWLMRTVTTAIKQPTKKPKIQQNFTTALKVFEEDKKVLETTRKTKHNIADQFTKFVYVTQAYNSTWTEITTPCRMDICPGAMVKCIVETRYMTYVFYGTVTGVIVNILPETNVSNTKISLTNIRTETLVNDTIENPKDPVGFYNNQWTGKDIALYD